MLFTDFKDITRESRTGDDHVYPGFNRAHNQVVKTLHGVHDIDGDNTVGGVLGLADILLQFRYRQAGAADGTDTTALCHRNRQGRSRHPYRHAALDKGDTGDKGTNFKFRQFHYFLLSRVLKGVLQIMLLPDCFVKYPGRQGPHINHKKIPINYFTTIRRHRLDFSLENRLNFNFLSYYFCRPGLDRHVRQ